MKQLDRLLFIQGGDCFFCKAPLVKADASIEHLVASANGGNNSEDNCVACCKTLNALLGNKLLKEKIDVFLRQKNGFKCPAQAANIEKPKAVESKTSPPVPKNAGIPVTRIPSVPKPMFTLAAPIQPQKIAAPARVQGVAAGSITCPTCRTSVPRAVGQIDYVCQNCRGAFRY